MTEKNYWYINKDYGYETDINKCLDWLLEMCKKYNCQKCFLAVYSNQNLGGMIQNVLGIKNVNRLKANKEVFLKDILLKVITERSNVYSLDGPVLIAFPTKNLLDKINALSNIPAVLVIPSSLKERDYWTTTFGAKSLDETAKD
mgnify:FL=1